MSRRYPGSASNGFGPTQQTFRRVSHTRDEYAPAVSSYPSGMLDVRVISFAAVGALA